MALDVARARVALLFAAFAAACSGRAPKPIAAPVARAVPCENLVALGIPNVTVTSAARDASGAVTTSLGRTTVPPFCRIKAVARAGDSEIHMELWLPDAASHNGKIVGTGNGRYSGDLSYGAMATALSRGYAVGGHDTGHTGDDPSFGVDHPEKIADFAYRAVHVMTTTLKDVVRAHYGRPAARGYFASCSSGGHQALSEVQRYPDDYDGVVARAPGHNRIAQVFGFLWSWLALHDANGAPILGDDELRGVTKAAIAQCDAQDGLADGIIDDPRRCTFDVGSLACGRGQSPPCLSDAQVDAIRKVHAGLTIPRTGAPVYAGFAKGSESLGVEGAPGWRTYFLDPKEPPRADVVRTWLLRDPKWDYRSVDWERDLAKARANLPILEATQADLSAFAARGGKLILQAGWADPVTPPEDTLAYYEAITRAHGPEKTRAFARLFMAPGMAHCQGGVGPDTIDALGEIDRWVTTGTAPDRIVAKSAARSRPLCAYPEVARYKGAGNTDDAESFACVAPPPYLTLDAMRELRARPLAAWTQEEREYVFPRWTFVRATRPVKRGARVHALPDGGPLAALALGGALAARLDRFIADENVAGMMILVDGKVRLERYARGHGEREGWPSFSVVKSITSTLVGAAIADGAIKSIDDPVTKYIAGLRGSAYEGVTVRQLLTMTSGVKWNEDVTDPNADGFRFFQGPHAPGTDATVEYMRMLPREAPPGKKWVYKTGETNLLGVLVAEATKKPLAEYLSEKIWSAYGMEANASWQLDRSDREQGGSGLVATLRDWARFGQFVLDDGVVDGRRVVPAKWFADATRKQVTIDRSGAGYGYQWWTNDDGMFLAAGIFGQAIAIDRARKTVVVMQGVWPVATSKERREPRTQMFKLIAEAVDAERR